MWNFFLVVGMKQLWNTSAKMAVISGCFCLNRIMQLYIVFRALLWFVFILLTGAVYQCVSS